MTDPDPLAFLGQDLQAAHVVLPEKREELQVGMAAQAYRARFELLVG